MPILCLLVLGLLPAAARAALPAAQRQFFDDFCASTNVAQFPASSPWCVGSDPCAWTGVECDTETGAVVEKLNVDFDVGLPLTGSLPESVAAFSSLTEFSLYCANSFFAGNLTAAFLEQNAETLQRLVVVECPLLEGQLPETQGLHVVQHIEIHITGIGHRLTQAFLEGSASLVFLQISSSDIVGPLPDAFLEYTELEVLDLSSNKLTGAFPPTLCGLPSLKEIFLQQNYLNEFPDCIGDLDPRILCDISDNYVCDAPLGLLPCIAGGKDANTPPAKVDVCDVCGGNGTSCLDCFGVPFGGASADVCGTCNGNTIDPAECPDCAGTAGGTLEYDACGVCAGDNSTCTDCAGVVGGSAKKDLCHVCDGDGSTCTDCYGQLYGTAKYDVCGVCNGDGDTCDDCDGTPGGSKVIDACGVCGGNGLACRDCAGTANGTLTYDACDVCGGDGTTCGIEFIRRQTGSSESIYGTLLLILLGLCVFATCPLFLCFLYQREQARR